MQHCKDGTLGVACIPTPRSMVVSRVFFTWDADRISCTKSERTRIVIRVLFQRLRTCLEHHFSRFRSLELLIHPASDGRGKSIAIGHERAAAVLGALTIKICSLREKDRFVHAFNLARLAVADEKIPNPSETLQVLRDVLLLLRLQSEQSTVWMSDLPSHAFRMNLLSWIGFSMGRHSEVHNWGTMGCVLQHFLGCGGDALHRG